MAGKAQIKALALFSGGLDSVLATKIILEQGIEVEAVYFVNAFLNALTDQKRIAEQLGVNLHILDISDIHLHLVCNPRYGYGENMNPCIDCRILMLKEAKAYMQNQGFHFLISGEVLGQRPMSQRRDALNIIDRDADVKRVVLRPLSAKKLTPTLAEEKGWVDRDRLFDFSGRSRKPQLALAKKLGIKEYLTPAGGCLLTEAEFVRKFKDLLTCEEFGLEDVHLLKVGRHFRSNSKAKSWIVVGRNEQENRHLLECASEADILFKMRNFAGPLTILRRNGPLFSDESIETAAKLTARYSRGKDKQRLWVDYWSKSANKKKSILVEPAQEELIEKVRI